MGEPVIARPIEQADSDESAKQESSSASRIGYIFAFSLSLLACLCIALYYNWESCFKYLFNTIEANKEYQVLQAVVINTLLVILIVGCMPGPGFLMILNGFFFGFWKGFAVSFVAEYIAYWISVMLARTWLRVSIREWLTTHSTLRELVLICEQDPSGKFLVLVRFLMIPVWSKNYSNGLMELGWAKIALVCIPGMAFWVAKFTYIGYKSRQMAEAMRKGDQKTIMEHFSGLEMVMVGTSITVMILLTVMGWYEYNARHAAMDAGEGKPLIGSA